MSTLTIRLPDDKHDRLRQLAKHRDISVNINKKRHKESRFAFGSLELNRCPVPLATGPNLAHGGREAGFNLGIRLKIFSYLSDSQAFSGSKCPNPWSDFGFRDQTMTSTCFPKGNPAAPLTSHAVAYTVSK